MGWITKILPTIKSAVSFLMPTTVPGMVVEASKNMISDAVASKIKDEATARAYELLAESHRTVIYTILWQNALLTASIFPVYYLHSAIPFYLGYGCVVAYTGWSVIKSWPVVKLLLRTWSIEGAVTQAVRAAIDEDLQARRYYQKVIVEFLSPDLDTISNSVAKKLTPDIRAVFLNMGITLLMSFLAFRLVALPLLEHRALA